LQKYFPGQNFHSFKLARAWIKRNHDASRWSKFFLESQKPLEMLKLDFLAVKTPKRSSSTKSKH
jgi:hypothetical protein